MKFKEMRGFFFFNFLLADLRDTYEQNLPPENEIDLITFDDLVDREKPSYIFPSYDSYQVSAQGLSGSLTPRLFENGTLIGQGKNIETDPESLDRFYVNYHFGDGSNNFKKWLNGTDDNKIYFYFDNMFGNNIDVNRQLLGDFGNNNNIDDYLGNSNSVFDGRAYSSNYVQAIFNIDINQSNILEAVVGNEEYNRSGAPENGIGGYQITTADGKTYHYMLPVYHFEEIRRTIIPTESDDKDYREVRRVEPYATHWLLTAITGPDYIKKTNSSTKYPTEDDYGYWVRFDYSKWTDGFTWRTPYTEHYWMTYENNADEEDVMKEFSFGRKQLVYLDKVVTRTHTALFIKSKREDGVGAYIYELPRNRQEPYKIHELEPYFYDVKYLSEKSLKLDEIILLKNNDVPEFDLASYQGEQVNIRWNDDSYQFSYRLGDLDNVLDASDLTSNGNGGYTIYEKALKVVKFNQNYSLAIGTMSTTNPGTIGRLTLNELILGKNATTYTPSYKFNYINDEQHPYIECTDDNSGNCPRDPWGFYKDYETLWSLNEIETPTGGTIKIQYEKDDYYTEAFTRRFWKDNLGFKVMPGESPDHYFIRVENEIGHNTIEDFRDYFEINKKVYLDLRISYTLKKTWQKFYALIDINPKKISSMTDYPIVEDCGNDFVKLKIKKDMGYDINCHGHEKTGDIIGRWQRGNISGDWDNLNNWTNSGEHCNTDILNRWDSSEYSCQMSDISQWNINGESGQGHNYESGDRDVWPENDQQGHHNYTMYYGIIANKLPIEDASGGLRVARLEVSDENGNTYTTEYDYRYPDPEKDESEWRTSGITPYAPVRGTKYVPYQSELPPPRVMYEYVTVKSKGANNTYLGYSTYNFNSLKPVFDIFNSELEIEGLFKAEVNKQGEIDPSQKIVATNVLLHDNTAALGTLLSTAVYNNVGHKISEKRITLLNYEDVGEGVNPKGVFQESFHSLRSIGEKHWELFPWPPRQVVELKKRLLNASSKKTYPLVIEKTEEISGNETSTTWHQNWDPIMGKTLDTKTQMADKSYILSQTVPAYKYYTAMGSKVDDSNYKHMLTQEAMNITKWSQDGTSNWKTLNIGITTWNKEWKYRDQLGNETINDIDVWRKHKTFAWKDDLNPDGTYATNVSETNDFFNWGTGEPTSGKWQKSSEITRYTHWSLPIEGTDINNNFVASKMVDDFTKTSVSGNARYTEMYYTGCEHKADVNIFESEISGASYQSDDHAHTGDFSAKINQGNQAFAISVEVGADHADTTKKFRPGKYKVSAWRYAPTGTKNEQTALSLFYMGIEIEASDYIEAGDWTQYIFFVDMQSGESSNLYLTPDLSGNTDLDDFRMHPVYASINSYVYDHVTDELIYILGSNNMGTRYVYDYAGRLSEIYKEVEYIDENNPGGFKLINEYKYHYDED